MENQKQVNVNIQNLEYEKCPKCSYALFRLAYELRIVPALTVGNPKPMYIKMERFVCVSCGNPIEQK